jgi:TRAP-type C4-dicarboxylate transport system permease large subunit
VPLREINREIWQFCAALSVVLFILAVFPALTLWLPRLFGYGG